MHPHKLVIAYDGTRYFGWQKTKTGPSIQEELQKAVFRITQEMVEPEAASRTDRGVHAEGQVVQFFLQKPRATLQRALNGVLPDDIRVVSQSACALHPTLDAVGKEYVYKISQKPVQTPFDQLYAWHFPYELDVDKMGREADALIGTHDFSAFANEKEKDTMCTVDAIQFNGDLEITIRGNRFLYKMVRNIVGTLIYIGCGKLENMQKIIASKDRKQAGITAPAHGLFLRKVFYKQ